MKRIDYNCLNMIVVILLSTWHDVQIVLIDIYMYGKLTIRN